jgi:hypothetical protein
MDLFIEKPKNHLFIKNMCVINVFHVSGRHIMESKHIEINKVKNKNMGVVFDESFKIIEKSSRCWGSGNYRNIIFKCSKCGKMYTTFGALKHYHKKCRGEDGK